MAQQENKQEVMIQLPWTVPQQPNVQMIVVQQPAKTHMELNASTDKTAISSFALSVIFALILGGFATWLSYWYGRKSFDLTKQSFEAVIKQIESSERQMMESNQNLMKSQHKQLITAHKIDAFHKDRDELKSLLVNFLTESENLSTFIGFTVMESANMDLSNYAQQGTYSFEIFKEHQNRIKQLQSLKVKISFEVFYYANDLQTEFNAILKDIVQEGALLNNGLFSKSSNLQEDIKKYREHIEKFKMFSKHLLKNEIILEKFIN